MTLHPALVGALRWFGRAPLRLALAGGGLGEVAWLPRLAASLLGELLSETTFVTVSMVLDGLGYALQIDHAVCVIGLEESPASVAPVCSGVGGIGLFQAHMTGSRSSPSIRAT